MTPAGRPPRRPGPRSGSGGAPDGRSGGRKGGKGRSGDAGGEGRGSGGPAAAGRAGGAGGTPRARHAEGPARNVRPPRSGGKAGLGGEQIEGRRPVLEALKARRRRIREVWLAGDLEPAPILTEIMERARAAGAQVRTTNKLESMAVTDAHQGVVARGDQLPVAIDDDLLADPSAFLVAVDGVTDPRNLGAILRVAEGAGATGILLPRRRAVHVTPAVAKAAAGAVEHLPMALVPGIPATLERARRAGVWCVGLDERGDHDLFSLDLGPEPVLLAFGAEGKGLGRLARERCDLVVRIPMLGSLASLNVATAAALACYEVARRRTRRVAD